MVRVYAPLVREYSGPSTFRWGRVASAMALVMKPSAPASCADSASIARAWDIRASMAFDVGGAAISALLALGLALILTYLCLDARVSDYPNDCRSSRVGVSENSVKLKMSVGRYSWQCQVFTGSTP